MRKPGKDKAPWDTSLRPCILQEAHSLHINLLLDWHLWLLLNFSLSGPVVDWGGGVGWTESINIQKTTHAFAHVPPYRQGLALRWPCMGRYRCSYTPERALPLAGLQGTQVNGLLCTITARPAERKKGHERPLSSTPTPIGQ